MSKESVRSHSLSMGRVNQDLPPTNDALKKFSIRDNRLKLLENDSIIPSKTSARREQKRKNSLNEGGTTTIYSDNFSLSNMETLRQHQVGISGIKYTPGQGFKSSGRSPLLKKKLYNSESAHNIDNVPAVQITQFTK